MQIVIDIPDKYTSLDTSIKEWIDKAGDDCKVTPLPKGHGKLIDADEVKELVKGWSIYAIDKALTIIDIDEEN